MGKLAWAPGYEPIPIQITISTGHCQSFKEGGRTETTLLKQDATQLYVGCTIMRELLAAEIYRNEKQTSMR